jgi:hypothetical protein
MELVRASLCINPSGQGIYVYPNRLFDVDRDTELRVKGHLYELDKLDDEYLDTKQGFHSAEQGYAKTLESVAQCAGTEMVDLVADKVKEHIRSEGERPDNKSVRRDARMLLSEEGFVADEYLNRS